MKQLAIGIMSGTSLDGIDIALVEIDEQDGIQSIQMIAGKTYPYPSELRTKVRRIINPNTCTAALVGSVHFELGAQYASVVTRFLEEQNLSIDQIAHIASHGQTVWHITQDDDLHSSSLQLGDGSVISTLTGRPVVSNFRNADIAVGGTGAPLVPFVDYILYRNRNQGTLVQNIGGISNLTIVPGRATIQGVFAFDTGPGNLLINEAMEQLYQKPYDNNGEIAASGTIQQELVQEILSHPYYRLLPPKSTGREVFGSPYVQDLLRRFNTIRPADIIASITYATAQSILQAYQRFVFPFYDVTQVIVSGGGMHNNTLMNYLKDGCSVCDFSISDDHGIPSDYKEAVAFAVLGHQTMHGRSGNVPNATGASRAVRLGQISYPTQEVER